jgi:FAD/FMN-containing dehydrogenase
MEKDPVHNREENLKKALEALKEALGEEWATDSPSILCGYARDQSFTPASYPHIVCLPGSVEDVQAVYKIANEYLIDVTPYGTGLTTYGLTLPPYGGIVADLRRMDSIIELDGENMFATIEPGINFLELQAAAQRVGCRVLNPSSPCTAGVISNHMFCNINTMASKYGFGMDNMLSTEAVLPTGEILKTGAMSYGAIAGHVQGPGPDISTMLRYACGNMGIITKMTLRLYPEQPCHQQMFPAYEEDRLEVMAEAVQKVAQDNLSLELAHLMNSFYGIFIGDDNNEMSTIAGLMPRHNLLTIFGGETQEEADMKAELTEKMLAENYPDFEFLPKEAILDMTDASEYVDLDKWAKYFNVTVRVMRVRGSFIIGALIDKLSNIPPIEKTMREACTNQSGTNYDALPPDDASTYLQPYHMGRSAYLEYDVYANQGDKDDLIRILTSWARATFGAIGQGMITALGGGVLVKGLLPSVDAAMAAAMPNLVIYMDVVNQIKMAVDPNNISYRRWEYEDGCMKKIHFLF